MDITQGTLSSVCYSAAAGGPVNVTVGDIEVINHTEIVKLCKCDDTGAGAVPFVHAYHIETLNAGAPTITDLGRFTDESLSTAYTLVGTEVDCDSIGTQVTGVEPEYVRLAGAGTWSKSTLSARVHIDVIAIGNPLSPPTMDTGSGAAPIDLGVKYEFGTDGTELLIGTLSVSTGAGDIVAIRENVLTTA